MRKCKLRNNQSFFLTPTHLTYDTFPQEIVISEKAAGERLSEFQIYLLKLFFDGALRLVDGFPRGALELPLADFWLPGFLDC